ncbi:MAG: DUF4388 domain-containing protein [Acidobacteriota bacterium]
MDAQFNQKILFETLREIDQAEMSGVLMLNTGNDTFYIYFQTGKVICAFEALPGGQRAIELNRRQVLQLGRLVDGMMRFDTAAQPPQRRDWQIRALELILEAARKTEDEAIWHEEFGDLRYVLQPVFNIEERTHGLLLTQEEVAILNEMEQPIPIKQLITHSGFPLEVVRRSLYALRAAGIIESPQPPAASEEVEKSFVATPVSSVERPPLAQPVPPPAQAVQAFRASPVPTPSAKSESAFREQTRNSKINTGKLEALAGVKIRSSGGRNDAAGEANTESENFFRQARSALNMGNMAGAEALLRKAVSLAPEHQPYLLALGRLLAKSAKRQREAEGFLLKACGNDPFAVEPRMVLADLYESLGMNAKAETMLKSVLNIDSNHETAKRKLNDLTGGSSWKTGLGGLLNRWKK